MTLLQRQHASVRLHGRRHEVDSKQHRYQGRADGQPAAQGRNHCGPIRQQSCYQIRPAHSPRPPYHDQGRANQRLVLCAKVPAQVAV